MKKILFLLALTGSAFADDQLRNAQMELKSQGFYYGEATGQSTADTTAAIRRFQIRNGLEVTGELNKETLDALALGGATKPPEPQVAPPPAAQPASPAASTRPPVNLRRDETAEDSDRAFLRREETRRQPLPEDPAVVPPPAPVPEATSDFATVFQRTPYATAPPEVQEQTLRRAQTLLAQRGFYRGAIDGTPGPATEEALLGFQSKSRLPLTGRLDLQTLSTLRLLPGRAPVKPFYPAPQPAPRVYRGVIVE